MGLDSTLYAQKSRKYTEISKFLSKFVATYLRTYLLIYPRDVACDSSKHSIVGGWTVTFTKTHSPV